MTAGLLLRNGGMSSGHVSPQFWREIATPCFVGGLKKHSPRSANPADQPRQWSCTNAPSRPEFDLTLNQPKKGLADSKRTFGISQTNASSSSCLLLPSSLDSCLLLLSLQQPFWFFWNFLQNVDKKGQELGRFGVLVNRGLVFTTE